MGCIDYITLSIYTDIAGAGVDEISFREREREENFRE